MRQTRFARQPESVGGHDMTVLVLVTVPSLRCLKRDADAAISFVRVQTRTGSPNCGWTKAFYGIRPPHHKAERCSAAWL